MNHYENPAFPGINALCDALARLNLLLIGKKRVALAILKSGKWIVVRAPNGSRKWLRKWCTGFTFCYLPGVGTRFPKREFAKSLLLDLGKQYPRRIYKYKVIDL